MNAFSKTAEYYEFLPLYKTFFQVEFSVWMLLLWSVHMQFPIQNQYIHMNRENQQQKQVNPGEYPKILVPMTMWKHSLNIMKPWSLQNTWNLCNEKPVSYWNLNISYGHNFDIESNLGIMYWNLHAHKM